MSKQFDYPDIVHATGSEYLDPLDCGSMIAYKIVSRAYFDATITLADCNRKIEWLFNNDNVEKVDKAISMLTEFRKELLKAGKKWKKIEEEAEKFRAEQEKLKK